MLVAFFASYGDPIGQNSLGFVIAGFARQQLAIHQVGWHIIRVVLQESFKMLVCSGSVPAVHAFHRETVARESIIRLFRYKFLQRLTPGFLWFSHGVYRSIRCVLILPN